MKKDVIIILFPTEYFEKIDVDYLKHTTVVDNDFTHIKQTVDEIIKEIHDKKDEEFTDYKVFYSLSDFLCACNERVSVEFSDYWIAAINYENLSGQ